MKENHTIMHLPRNVLIAQPYGIGDLLFLTPVLRALRLIPTVKRVDLLLGSRSDVVVRQNPHIDKIYLIDKDRIHKQSFIKNLTELYHLGNELRKNQYDLFLDYSQRQEYSIIALFVLGIRVRAGLNYKNRGFFLSHKVNIPDGFNHKHVVDFYCEVAEKAGVLVEDRFLEFFNSDEDGKFAESFFENSLGGLCFAVVAPGGGESWGKDAHFKRWPVPFFVQLIEKMRKKISFGTVVILGSSSENQLAKELIAQTKIKCHDLTGKISLSEAAYLIQKSKLFLGNDGGLMHLARACQVPLVALFGPVDPVVYGPYPHSRNAVAVVKNDLPCRPCYQKFRYKSDCAHRECLQALEPDEVMSFLDQKHFFDCFQRELIL